MRERVIKSGGGGEQMIFFQINNGKEWRKTAWRGMQLESLDIKTLTTTTSGGTPEVLLM